MTVKMYFTRFTAKSQKTNGFDWICIGIVVTHYSKIYKYEQGKIGLQLIDM